MTDIPFLMLDDEKSAGFFGDLTGRGEIGDAHQWIRRSLDEYRASVRRNCVSDILRISRVDEREAQSITSEDLVEQSKRSAINIFAADNVIA